MNFVTDEKGVASAVLIRAVEPMNFDLRCSGPGLLTNSLKICKRFHGEDVCNFSEIWVEDNNDEFEIVESKRIGVTENLEKPFRFYVRGNRFVSRV